jgi:hypothetical protein
MRQLSVQNVKNETIQVEKTATAIIKKIRDAILDDVFKPGDWLPEFGAGEKIRSQPVAYPRSAARAGEGGHGNRRAL